MAQDITLLGASYFGVPSVLLPKSGGGQAKFIDEATWNWKSVEPKLIGTIATRSYTLANTDYDTWAASTTTKVLIATENATTFVADMANKSYALRWRWQIDVKHLDGVTLKALPVYQCGEIWYLICRRPSNLTNLTANTFNGNVAINTRSPAIMEYYNSSGTHTMTYAASYGFYCGASAPTFSNSTANSPTVTVKTPTVNTRCSSSYFATDRKPYIDTTTPIKFICEQYELPTITCIETQLHEGVVDLYNHPLT